MSSLPPIKCCRVAVKFSLSLRQSFIDQHCMKGEEDCRTVSFVSATIVGSKNTNIHLRDF